jgi:hypothetical protein
MPRHMVFQSIELNTSALGGANLKGSSVIHGRRGEGRRFAMHVEFDSVGCQDNRFWMMSVFEERIFYGLRPADE